MPSDPELLAVLGKIATALEESNTLHRASDARSAAHEEETRRFQASAVQAQVDLIAAIGGPTAPQS